MGTALACALRASLARRTCPCFSRTARRSLFGVAGFPPRPARASRQRAHPFLRPPSSRRRRVGSRRGRSRVPLRRHAGVGRARSGPRSLRRRGDRRVGARARRREPRRAHRPRGGGRASRRPRLEGPPPASLARLRLGDRPGALAEAISPTTPTRRRRPARPNRPRASDRRRGRRAVPRAPTRQPSRPGLELRPQSRRRHGRHGRAHHVAYQRFLPEGPLALLPVADGAKSNVVWTTTPEEADRLVGLPHDAFAAEVHDALHGLGRYRYDGRRRKRRDVAEAPRRRIRASRRIRSRPGGRCRTRWCREC